MHDIYFSGNEVRNGDFHAGIAVDSTYNVEITNNYIHDNGLTDIDHGIYFRHQAGGGHIIANNVIVANRGRGISMHDNEGLPINNAVVVHNTIIGNGSTGILVATNGGSGNVIANNILANSGHIEGYNQITLRSGSGNLIYNNIVWSTLLARQGVGIESGVSGNLLSGNLALDPKFQGYASRDFHLLSGSPAIGLSRTEYAVNLDFEGYLRDLAADAGAYEAEAGLTPPPPEQTGIKKFVAAYDGYTNSKSLSVNYGAKVTLAIDQDNGKETTRAYLRFIVVGAGAIKKATLRLYVTGASANGPAVYATDNSWSENLLKWSNQPAPIGSALDDRGALAVGMWAEYNVTELVKADGTFNFVLMATSDDSIFFSSRESINKPELVVEY